MLRSQWNRNSTRQNYYCIWKIFNNFVLSLDRIPPSWEEKLTLFLGYLVNEGRKSTTIKSYISAIKSVLLDIKVELSPDQYLLTSLTRACRLINDHVRIRLPLHKGQLNMLLAKAEEVFTTQPYLKVLHKALLVSAYYGLLRIGELTLSQHVIKAMDVQIGVNKNKILYILRSSKTHDKDVLPQLVKIESIPKFQPTALDQPVDRTCCPFAIIEEYIAARRPAQNINEQFFVFSDGSPVKPNHMSTVLKKLLKKCGFESSHFSVHSMRIGRSYDLLKLGLSVETIKKLGHWKSNAVFKYLRLF